MLLVGRARGREPGPEFFLAQTGRLQGATKCALRGWHMFGFKRPVFGLGLGFALMLFFRFGGGDCGAYTPWVRGRAPFCEPLDVWRKEEAFADPDDPAPNVTRA